LRNLPFRIKMGLNYTQQSLDSRFSNKMEDIMNMEYLIRTPVLETYREPILLQSKMTKLLINQLKREKKVTNRKFRLRLIEQI
jgi:hypothetical protein